MKWQEAERELRGWEAVQCNFPITHTPHGNCPGLTLAAHNLMFARLDEQNARKLREEIAGSGD